MKELLQYAHALAEPNRVRILAALRDGELCVCELCDALVLTQSTLSTHLRVIRAAGLITARRQGKWSYYAIAPAATATVEALFSLFRPSMESDRRLARDLRRLKERIAMRSSDGDCCVGFGCGPSRSSGKRGSK